MGAERGITESHYNKFRYFSLASLSTPINYALRNHSLSLTVCNFSCRTRYRYQDSADIEEEPGTILSVLFLDLLLQVRYLRSTHPIGMEKRTTLKIVFALGFPFSIHGTSLFFTISDERTILNSNILLQTGGAEYPNKASGKTIMNRSRLITLVLSFTIIQIFPILLTQSIFALSYGFSKLFKSKKSVFFSGFEIIDYGSVYGFYGFHCFYGFYGFYGIDFLKFYKLKLHLLGKNQKKFKLELEYRSAKKTPAKTGFRFSEFFNRTNHLNDNPREKNVLLLMFGLTEKTSIIQKSSRKYLSILRCCYQFKNKLREKNLKCLLSLGTKINFKNLKSPTDHILILIVYSRVTRTLASFSQNIFWFGKCFYMFFSVWRTVARENTSEHLDNKYLDYFLEYRMLASDWLVEHSFTIPFPLVEVIFYQRHSCIFNLTGMERTWQSMVQLPTRMETQETENREESVAEGPEATPRPSTSRGTLSNPELTNYYQVNAHEDPSEYSSCEETEKDREKVEKEDEEDKYAGRIDLGARYKTCKAARAARTEHEVSDISTERFEGAAEEGTTIKKERMSEVGSMNDAWDDDIKKCFHGARIEQGGQQVHQFLSCSFDPATMRCITCDAEHNVGGEGECYVLSDQNFFATVPGAPGKKCMNVIRIENGGIMELAQIFNEIMENKPLQSGTCILLGSLSYLAYVGASIYANEWRAAVRMLNRRWPGVLICPLVHIVQSQIDGAIMREVLAISRWFRKVYEGTTQGLSMPWDIFINCLIKMSEGEYAMDTPDRFTFPMPASLDENSPIVPWKFSSFNSSPVQIGSMDRKAAGELVRSLCKNLERDFGFKANPEGILARENSAENKQGAKDKKTLQNIICVGGSNLKDHPSSDRSGRDDY